MVKLYWQVTLVTWMLAGGFIGVLLGRHGSPLIILLFFYLINCLFAHRNDALSTQGDEIILKRSGTLMFQNDLYGPLNRLQDLF